MPQLQTLPSYVSWWKPSGVSQDVWTTAQSTGQLQCKEKVLNFQNYPAELGVGSSATQENKLHTF